MRDFEAGYLFGDSISKHGLGVESILRIWNVHKGRRVNSVEAILFLRYDIKQGGVFFLFLASSSSLVQDAGFSSQ